MQSIQSEMPFLLSLVKGIAAQFGEHCEVVLHDLSKPYDQTMVAIENGHVTGRTIGGPGTNLGLELLRGTTEDGNRLNYITQTKDERLLRSTSLYMRDQAGQVIGSLCINMDITDLTMAEQALRSLTMTGLQPEVRESFVTNVTDLLDVLIQEAQEIVKKPVSSMAKEDKLKMITCLDQKGAFLIKKSSEKICAYLGISKYTLYSYLNEIKQSNHSEG